MKDRTVKSLYNIYKEAENRIYYYLTYKDTDVMEYEYHKLFIRKYNYLKNKIEKEIIERFRQGKLGD